VEKFRAEDPEGWKDMAEAVGIFTNILAALDAALPEEPTTPIERI
jgi:hypothetical protein